MPPAKIIKTKARGRRAEKIRQNLHKAVLTKASHKLKKNYHEISPPQSHNSLKKCILVFFERIFSRVLFEFSRAQFCIFFSGRFIFFSGTILLFFSRAQLFFLGHFSRFFLGHFENFSGRILKIFSGSIFFFSGKKKNTVRGC